MRIPIAVLGCGSIGLRHLRNLRALGYENLIAFDPAPNARAKVESEMDVKCHGLLEAVWAENPIAVLITAPSSLHMELAIAAGNQQCHLFVEKPLSHTLDRVDELLEIVKRHQLITMVGCNMRFHPGPAMVKRLIDEGEPGDILAARLYTGSYLPDWRPLTDYRSSYSANEKMGGGALLDCIHEIDLALWYFGKGRVIGSAVKAATTLGLEVDGLAEILIEHDSSVLTSVHLNFVQRDYRRGCEIVGEKGTIYWSFAAPFVELHGGHTGIKRYVINTGSDTGGRYDEMYLDEISHFTQCVERRTQSMCPVSDGKSALEIVLAAKHRAVNKSMIPSN
jgi:predicted dehydrogenase